jgi:uncharacterized damage-inducible protein DinB
VTSEPPPSPSDLYETRAQVFVAYLDYFRSRLVVRIEQLSPSALRESKLESGWTPLELLKHLTYVELRRLEWGFKGVNVDEPWGDRRDDRWFVDDSETLDDLLKALAMQAARSRAIIEASDLQTVGQPGPRWKGQQPPTLERILFHLLGEYARHVGHLDIVCELVIGSSGE